MAKIKRKLLLTLMKVSTFSMVYANKNNKSTKVDDYNKMIVENLNKDLK